MDVLFVFPIYPIKKDIHNQIKYLRTNKKKNQLAFWYYLKFEP